MSKIRAIVYGVGEMGRIVTRFMVEKGVDVVGAIDLNPEIVGKDLGEVVGLGYPLNVQISDDADSVVCAQQADIAVVALLTEMERIYPHLEKCIENGLNVITTSEEAFYAWTTSPVLASRLDKLARKHAVTVTGGGYQDVFLVNLITLLTGTSHTIKSISGRERYNIDDYGPVVARHNHVGQTEEEFEKDIAEEGIQPSYFRMNLESLVADLGLTIKEIVQRSEPTIDDVDIKCKSLDTTVKTGQVTGMSDIVDIDTEQGIKVHGELIGKVYRENEVDMNDWLIEGVPDTYLRNDRVAIKTTTCTQMVNRIPDVINAEPGYITVEKLPKLRYRAFPLHYYLK
ncbi:MAG: dihydrodipicolinate reductase [Dehalococcoidia bacterium]